MDKLDIDELKYVPTTLRNLNSKLNKLNIDRLVPAPVDLSKLCDVVKKHVYNATIKNIEDIST